MKELSKSQLAFVIGGAYWANTTNLQLCEWLEHFNCAFDLR
jgi:hypothetical protein